MSFLSPIPLSKALSNIQEEGVSSKIARKWSFCKILSSRRTSSRWTAPLPSSTRESILTAKQIGREAGDVGQNALAGALALSQKTLFLFFDLAFASETIFIAVFQPGHFSFHGFGRFGFAADFRPHHGVDVFAFELAGVLLEEGGFQTTLAFDLEQLDEALPGQGYVMDGN